MSMRTYRYAIGHDASACPPDTEFVHRVQAHDMEHAAEAAAEDSDTRHVCYPDEQDVWVRDEATGEAACYRVTLTSVPYYIATRTGAAS